MQYAKSSFTDLKRLNDPIRKVNSEKKRLDLDRGGATHPSYQEKLPIGPYNWPKSFHKYRNI